MFHLNEEGNVDMPAFTFEKLPPPADRAPPQVSIVAKPASTKVHRGIIVQLLDRIAEAKLKRTGHMVATNSGKTR